MLIQYKELEDGKWGFNIQIQFDNGKMLSLPIPADMKIGEMVDIINNTVGPLGHVLINEYKINFN